MNSSEALNQALINFVTTITDLSQRAAQAGSEIMPEVIRQLLLSSAIKAGFGIVANVFCIICTIIIALMGRRYLNGYINKLTDSDERTVAKIVSVVIVIAIVINEGKSLYHNVIDLLTIQLTPYAYIIQHIKDLVN